MQTKLTNLPMLSLPEAVKLNIARFTDLKSRSRRSELWWNFLMYAIFAIAISFLKPFCNLILLYAITFLAQLTIVPVTIRRMHDGGHSGIWVIAAVIIELAANVYGFTIGLDHPELLQAKELMNIATNPVVLGLSTSSFIVQLVIFVFAVMDGDKQPNRYGASPKYVADIDGSDDAVVGN